MSKKSTQPGIARTPEPPYYSVTTTTELRPEFDQDAHMKWGTELYVKARKIDGFLGLEATYFGNLSIAVSYWASLGAIEAWRQHPAHSTAKARARADWFGPTITRIARVERDYGFNLEQA